MGIDEGVREVDRRLKEATSAGVVSLADYVRTIDEVASDVGCARDELHEEVRTALSDAYGIEAMAPASPGR